MHGFESLAERRLLATDFVAAADEVLSQPFRLRLPSKDGKGEHTSDLLNKQPKGTTDPTEPPIK
ncbi:hypothetical protein ACFV7R_24310 [Streptomyces sp. NPDC059866]|uniref:hypothetical protein n=1 Tax=Streptomyces sp. NPDC059866 TaxID=3346978 RepID=UPI003669E58C